MHKKEAWYILRVRRGKKWNKIEIYLTSNFKLKIKITLNKSYLYSTDHVTLNFGMKD